MLFICFLCWGSFLNVLAYRLIRNQNIIPRSRCTHCNKTIAWYDNIPLLSWVILGRKCRYCKLPISYLYPFIELLTALLLTTLFLYMPHHYFFAYFLFFSALIITIRSDLEYFLISRFATLFLIPIAFVFSYYGLLPISLSESIISAFVGFFGLYTLASFFYFFTKRHGIGQGDVDLLAFIGSFIGLFGLWATLLISSLSGTIIGLIYMFATGADRSVKIPFGPFLAFGAITYVLLQPLFITFFLCY